MLKVKEWNYRPTRRTWPIVGWMITQIFCVSKLKMLSKRETENKIRYAVREELHKIGR
jgi:hypothetical protein